MSGDPALVLSNGREMATLPLIRSLGRHGIPVVLASVVADNLAGYSKYVERFEIMPDPTRDITRWLNWLEGFLSRQQVSAIFPVSDNFVIPLNANRDRFATQKLMIVGQPEFELAYDKGNTVFKARELGIPVPKTERMTSLDQVSEIVSRFKNTFPLILKPASSRAIHNNRLYPLAVRRVHSLEQFKSDSEKLLPFGAILVQEFLTGHGLGQEFLLKDGAVMAEFQHERVHEPMEGGGGCYRVSMKMDAELRSHSLQLLQSVHWSGVAMVEYLLTADGRTVIMEINGRLWGSLPLPVAVGVDFPWLWYQSEVNNRFEMSPANYPVPAYCRNLERDIKWQRSNWKADHSNPSLNSVPRTRQLLEWFRFFSKHEYYDEFAKDDSTPGRYLFSKWFRKLDRKIALGLWQLPLFNSIYLAQSIDKVRKSKRIVVLCKGNTCRSPFLQNYLLKLTTEKKIPLPALDSRGILQKDGSESSAMARAAAAEFQIDLASHRSQSFYADSKSTCDVFLIVDPYHVDEVLAHYRPLKPQFIFAGLLDPREHTPLITDPDQTTPEIYRQVYSRLQRIGNRLVKGLSK